MVQDLPNAPGSFTRTSSNYALAVDGKVVIKSSIEHSGNALDEPGDGNNLTIDSDTRFVLANTTSSAADITIGNATPAGRVVTIIDAGGNAGSNAINVSTPSGGSNIDGSALDDQITTNSGQSSYIAGNSESGWFSF